jgi:hypothetical protein
MVVVVTLVEEVGPIVEVVEDGGNDKEEVGGDETESTGTMSVDDMEVDEEDDGGKLIVERKLLPTCF